LIHFYKRFIVSISLTSVMPPKFQEKQMMTKKLKTKRLPKCVPKMRARCKGLGMLDSYLKMAVNPIPTFKTMQEQEEVFKPLSPFEIKLVKFDAKRMKRIVDEQDDGTSSLELFRNARAFHQNPAAFSKRKKVKQSEVTPMEEPAARENKILSMPTLDLFGPIIEEGEQKHAGDDVVSVEATEELSKEPILTKRVSVYKKTKKPKRLTRIDRKLRKLNEESWRKAGALWRDFLEVKDKIKNGFLIRRKDKRREIDYSGIWNWNLLPGDVPSYVSKEDSEDAWMRPFQEAFDNSSEEETRRKISELRRLFEQEEAKKMRQISIQNTVACEYLTQEMYSDNYNYQKMAKMPYSDNYDYTEHYPVEDGSGELHSINSRVENNDYQQMYNLGEEHYPNYNTAGYEQSDGMEEDIYEDDLYNQAEEGTSEMLYPDNNNEYQMAEEDENKQTRMDQVAEEAQQSNTFDELHDIAEEFNEEECSSPGLLPEDSFLGEFSASEDEEDRESL